MKIIYNVYTKAELVHHTYSLEIGDVFLDQIEHKCRQQENKRIRVVSTRKSISFRLFGLHFEIWKNLLRFSLGYCFCLFVMMFAVILIGDQYYRFHTKRYEVVRGYPRPIYEFFRCPVVQTQRSSRVLALQRQQQRRGQDEKQSVLVAASSSTKKFHNGGLLILPSLLLMFIRCF